jgi:hypothetical protein
MRTQNRRLTMRHPSPLTFQSIHALNGFSITPLSRNPLKKDNHQLCVTSLSLETTEFPHTISKQYKRWQIFSLGTLELLIKKDLTTEKIAMIVFDLLRHFYIIKKIRKEK